MISWLIITSNLKNKGWLNAAEIARIPTFFIIKNKMIRRIGHPNDIENIIDSIIDRFFNFQGYVDKHNRYSMMDRELKSRMAFIQAAVNVGQIEKAIQLIDEGAIAIPEVSPSFRFEKFNLFLNKYPEQETIEFPIEIGDINRFKNIDHLCSY